MTNAQTKLRAFSAVFTVRDVHRSLDYFVAQLGFQEKFRLGDPISYASVERDAVSIHLKPPSRESDTVGRSGIYVLVTSVDGMQEELRARGCDIEVPPTDLFYGMREMALRDIDGNHITFGQHITPAGQPGQSV